MRSGLCFGVWQSFGVQILTSLSEQVFYSQKSSCTCAFFPAQFGALGRDTGGYKGLVFMWDCNSWAKGQRKKIFYLHFVKWQKV